MKLFRFLVKRISNIYKYIYYIYLRLSYTNTKFGKSLYLEKNIKFYKSGSIIIGDRSRIMSWAVLNPYGGSIEIGENCSINSFCHISGNGGVRIGNNVLLATQCALISANHNFDRTDMLICEQGETRKIIIIEDDCWLGAGVKVLAGVTIGKGSVIGAGGVVTKNIPPYSVCVGIPSIPIKHRNGEANIEK